MNREGQCVAILGLRGIPPWPESTLLVQGSRTNSCLPTAYLHPCALPRVQGLRPWPLRFLPGGYTGSSS